MILFKCAGCKKRKPKKAYAKPKRPVPSYCLSCACEASKRSQRKYRLAIIAFLGGRCSKCKRKYGLDVHHKNGLEGKPRLRAATKKMLELIKANPTKFSLLCVDCHRDTY